MIKLLSDSPKLIVALVISIETIRNGDMESSDQILEEIIIVIFARMGKINCGRYV